MPITPSISASIDQVTLKVNSQGQAYVDTANIIDGNTTASSTTNKIMVKTANPLNTISGVGLNLTSPLLIDSSNSLNISELSDITISANTQLSQDIYCINFTINSGITLTTNGYNIYCSGTFTNNGTIITGSYLQPWDGPPTNYPNSYGGSGGGGGSSSGVGSGNSGGAGSTPAAPTLSNSLIYSWKSNNLLNYLAGGPGGGAGGSIMGGSGSFGIYIQAYSIINNGTISSNGNNALSDGPAATDAIGFAGGSTLAGGGGGGASSGTSNQYPCGGGGGAGAILLSYQSSLTIGTITATGGTGYLVDGYGGGNGGNGNIMEYQYTTQPIPVVNIASNRAYLQNLVAQTTTSTTAVNIGSITIVSQNGGTIIIELIIRGSNNTLGDGIAITLLNGTTILDEETYTQEGLAGNEHTFTLHYETSSTIQTSYTFNVAINAITGGTASAKIKCFSALEETII